MDAVIVWIIFGLIYGSVTWLATRKDPSWWFIGMVSASGVFGILVIIAGIIVRIIKGITFAVNTLNRKELSPGEVEAGNKKRAVYVPVIFAVLVSIVLLVFYFLFDVDLYYIIRNCVKTVKNIFAG